jgi:hypothetical protein
MGKNKSTRPKVKKSWLETYPEIQNLIIVMRGIENVSLTILVKETLPLSFRIAA